MRRLQAAEREHRAAIEELIQLGAVRSHVLVGDLGERIAAMYHRVELLPQLTPGHDLVDRRGRRIDVKTLHAPPDKPRTIIGQPKRPSIRSSRCGSITTTHPPKPSRSRSSYRGLRRRQRQAVLDTEARQRARGSPP